MRKLVHTLDLRFEVGEPHFVQELALQSAWSCMLACLSFFWPFAILEAVSLVNELNELNELGGGNVDWPRALHVGACSLQVIIASALTAVSFLAGSARCLRVFKRLPLELLWAAIAILAFVLLWTSRPDPEFSPTKQSWLMLLIYLVIFCLPLRFHISWFVLLVAIIILPFDRCIATPDSCLLGFTILCACRLSWINERVLRHLFEIDLPHNIPCAVVPTINSSEGWTGSSSPAKQEIGTSISSLGRKDRSNRGSKTSQGCQGYDVERIISRDSDRVEDSFPVRNMDRSDKHRCMILPLREDFTIREVSVDVRLQIGYDIQGKHLTTILNPHSFDDIDFQSEDMYQVSDVVVCLASGPSPAKLCMLRTGLPDPAFFVMITPFSEALNAVQDPPEPISPGTARRSVWADLDTDTRRTTDQRGRRRSSPAVMVIDRDRSPSPTRNPPKLSSVPSLETLQRKRQFKNKKAASHSSLSGLSDLSHGNQQSMGVMRIGSLKSQQGKAPSRMASDSRLISESLIYSIDSHSCTDGHSFDGLWLKEFRDVNIQTEASTADSECQTDPMYSGVGALCRRCQRPPKIPMKRQGSGMYRKRLSSGGDPVDFLDTSEASEDFAALAALSPAEVLIHRIQGFWVLHQGPKNTAPWLQSFLVRGSEAESQEDALEIRTESERVYMAGGELSLDEDGFLHRYGQSGTHLVYTRLTDPQGVYIP